MPIAQTFLPELEHECATTRKLIALCPEQHAAWKPHSKSMALGGLALHLANILTWAPRTVQLTELDLAPPGGPPWTPPKFESIARTLSIFDANLAAARSAIAATSDAEMQVGWTLKKAGVPFFTLPRFACLRSFVLSHQIHHRGQLSVYLRLLDVPLPQVYGPTADAPL
jgi:uncharacterized damage-inducible protein DinB